MYSWYMSHDYNYIDVKTSLYITGLEVTFSHRTKTGQKTLNWTPKHLIGQVSPDKNRSRASNNRLQYAHIVNAFNIFCAPDSLS